MASPLLVTVATSSLLSSTVTLVVSAFRDGRRAKRDDRFSALYLALTLEAYAAQCAGCVGDSHMYEDSDGHAGQGWSNAPELPPWRTDMEWKALGIADTERVLAFASLVESTRSMLSSMWDFVDGEDCVVSVREQTVLLGLQALELAKDLRAKRSLSPRQTTGEWSFEDYLNERKAKYDDAKARVAKMSARELGFA